MSSVIENISLYIPHIFANYTKEDVAKVFDDQCIGNVKSIDFVSKMGKDGKVFNAAYVHFYEWYDNVIARNFHERVFGEEKEARIMYEDPWYWIVLENKARKHIPGERKQRIILDLPSMTYTPAKKESIVYCPQAPVKSNEQRQTLQLAPGLLPLSLDSAFSCVVFPEEDVTLEEMEWVEEIENQMDEVEAAMDEEEQYLESFDRRYIQAIEEENATFRDYCNQCYAAYCRAVEAYNAIASKEQTLSDINIV